MDISYRLVDAVQYRPGFTVFDIEVLFTLVLLDFLALGALVWLLGLLDIDVALIFLSSSARPHYVITIMKYIINEIK